ncbi:MAG TPA: ABC transporter substrate-binding protein [Acidimicrobiia bacterium]|nr:ABC transporter substrate-binding protein [Acidimicrobiia bacterium]
MRNKPKWLALFLVLGLVLAACGGGEGGDTTTTAAAEEEATTTAAAEEEPTTTAAAEEEPAAEIATDVGVDLEAGTITIGLLSDLSGPFSPLVQVINTGHDLYWASVNEAGGINGLNVQLEVRDTGYVVDTHVQLYEELKSQVVAFGHSTGSPHTVAINSSLQADGILAIPLTWYSGWSDPAINANLVPHGVPYCIEAMNMIEYLTTQAPDATTIAIASSPGDYGQDSNAGAVLVAEALGLEVVYDGTGTIVATDPATLAEAANGIAGSGAELVWVTTDPTSFGGVYGQALAAGFSGALWSGAGPSWNPALIGPDSPIAEPLANDFYISQYYAPWAADSPGNQMVRDLVEAAGAPPLDYYAEGVIEAKIMHEALLAAYEAGDMTQAGVLAAAKSLESVTFDGLAPDETYVGEANDRLQRLQFISRPDLEGLAGGTSTGATLIESDYTSPTAEAYQFDAACFALEAG